MSDAKYVQALEYLVREGIGCTSMDLAIFGTGDLGIAVATRLREGGVCAKAFADSRPATWGSSIAGIQVMSPPEARKLVQTAIIASVAHAETLTDVFRRLPGPEPLTIVRWQEPDTLPTTVSNLGPSSVDRLLLRSEALIEAHRGRGHLRVLLPDHSGAIEAFRERFPDVEVCTARTAPSIVHSRSSHDIWVVVDTSPVAARLFHSLSASGAAVYSPFRDEPLRIVSEWRPPQSKSGQQSSCT